MQLVNAKSGELEDVPQDSAHAALTAGTHNLIGGSPVNVLSPDGSLGSIPAEQVPEAMARYGFKLPTDADLSEYANQQKYGEGFGNELKAGAAGVARGATFGLSDVGLTKTGLVDPEALAELRKRNPAASTAGEIGGAVGSALLAPEASLPGLAGKLGTGIAAKLAPAAIEGGSLASKIVQAAKATGASAMGSAVEGALYGAGETVSEAALGDPDVSAERLAANLGFGALIGGGLGGLVKAGSLAVPASLDAAKGAISNFYDKFIGRPSLDAVEGSAAPDMIAHGVASAPPPEWQPSPASKAISALTGKSEEETRGLLQAAHEGELMSPEAKDKFVREFTDNLQEQYDTVQKASKDAINTIRPQETAKLLEGHDTQVAAGASSDAIAQLRHAAAEMRSNPDIYPARFPAKTEQILEGLEDRTLAPTSPEAAAQKVAVGEEVPLSRDYSLKMMSSTKGRLSSGPSLSDRWSVFKDGKMVGETINVPFYKGEPEFGDYATVSKIHLGDETGKGLGTEVYQKLLGHYGTLVSDADSTSPAAYRVWKKLGGKELPESFEKTGDLVKNAEGNPRLYAKLSETPGEKPVFSAADHFEAINQAKRSLDKLLKYSKDITGESGDAINLLRDVRGNLRAGLEDENTWGPAAARQAAYNASNHDLETAASALRKRFMEKVETKGGGITYKVKPSRVETYINQINDNRARPQTEALLNYFKSAKNHVQEIGSTYEGAPFESFDKEGIEGIMNKTQDNVMRAKSVLEAQPGGHGALTDVLHPLSAVHKAASRILANPVAAASTLANMERAAQKTAQMVERAAGAALKVPEGGIRGAEIPVKMTGAAIRGINLEDRRAKAEKQMRKLDEIQQSPDLIHKLDEWTQSTFDHAPKVTAALQQTAIRGIAFLSAKMPRPPQGMPLDQPRELGGAQLTAFSRYHDAVEDPVSVLKSLSTGKVPSESLEALQSVYPRLYDDMKQQIISKLAERGDKARSLPFQRRMAISHFIGQPLDSSMLYTASNQVILGGLQQEQDQKEADARAVRPSQKGLSSIDLSQRSLTGPQQIAAKQIS